MFQLNNYYYVCINLLILSLMVAVSDPVAETGQTQEADGRK
jgi:hypothetical protein